MSKPPVPVNRPDDWDDWPESARKDHYKRECTGRQIVRELGEMLGIDPNDIEWPSNSMKRAAINVLVEAEDDGR